MCDFFLRQFLKYVNLREINSLEFVMWFIFWFRSLLHRRGPQPLWWVWSTFDLSSTLSVFIIIKLSLSHSHKHTHTHSFSSLYMYTHTLSLPPPPPPHTHPLYRDNGGVVQWYSNVSLHPLEPLTGDSGHCSTDHEDCLVHGR